MRDWMREWTGVRKMFPLLTAAVNMQCCLSPAGPIQHKQLIYSSDGVIELSLFETRAMSNEITLTGPSHVQPW